MGEFSGAIFCLVGLDLGGVHYHLFISSVTYLANVLLTTSSFYSSEVTTFFFPIFSMNLL